MYAVSFLHRCSLFSNEVSLNLDYCFEYIDDLLIASATQNDHLKHVSTIFLLCTDMVLLSTQASHFSMNSLHFLSHCVVISKGIMLLVTLFVNSPSPLRPFFGLVNFSSHIVPFQCNPFNKLTPI